MGKDTLREVVLNLEENEVEVLEESLAEVDDEGEGEEQDSQPAKKRKRKSAQVILAEETERQLGDWLEFDVPYFYNRGVPDYKNKAKQQAVLEEKGKSLDPPLTALQLEQWLTTIRTRYGRLQTFVLFFRPSKPTPMIVERLPKIESLFTKIVHLPEHR